MNDLISFNDDDNNLAQQNRIISQQNTPFQELYFARQKLIRSVKWYIDRDM